MNLCSQNKMYSLNLNKTEALKTQEHEAYNEIATRLQRDHGSLKISTACIERHHTSPRAPRKRTADVSKMFSIEWKIHPKNQL
jgi:hypothetical protein